MNNDPRAWLGRTGIVKDVSKATEAKANVTVREHTRGKPMTKSGRGAMGSQTDNGSTAASANIEGNESPKYEALEKKSLRSLKHGGSEKELRDGHNEKTYKGKSMAPGGGGRFAKQVDAIEASGKSEASAKAIAAKAGRKKYGKSTFQQMAAAGRKRAMKK